MAKIIRVSESDEALNKRKPILYRLEIWYRKFLVKHSPQQNLVLGFLLYTIVGWLLLCFPIFHKQAVPFLDHLFIATSAISTTGLVTVSVFDTYNIVGQFIVMLLFQIGGVGYMTFTTYYLLATTRTITHWHERLIKAEFTMPKEIRIHDFLKSVIVFTVLMEVLGTICFFIAFKQEDVPTGFALWSSLFHSISAFCTAGFGLYNNSFEGFSDNVFINFTISVLAICGSLGFIVVTDLWGRLTKKTKSITFTSKIIVYGFLCLLSIGTILVYVYEPIVQPLNLQDKLLASFFQAMTAMTTVGFNTISTGNLSLPMLLLVTFLMFIGASPSGTAGGLKITTFTAILSIIKSRLRGDKNITFLNRSIPFERLYVATSTFIFYTTLIFLATFLLTFSESSTFQNLLFEVASSLGTVGLSTGITGDLSNFGKIIIILLMFIGRVGVLTFGFALLARKNKADENTLEDDLAV